MADTKNVGDMSVMGIAKRLGKADLLVLASAVAADPGALDALHAKLGDENIDCAGCYDSTGCVRCTESTRLTDCADCMWCKDCKDCRFCIDCEGLTGHMDGYWIENKSVSQGEWDAAVEACMGL